MTNSFFSYIVLNILKVTTTQNMFMYLMYVHNNTTTDFWQLSVHYNLKRLRCKNELNVCQLCFLSSVRPKWPFLTKFSANCEKRNRNKLLSQFQTWPNYFLNFLSRAWLSCKPNSGRTLIEWIFPKKCPTFFWARDLKPLCIRIAFSSVQSSIERPHLNYKLWRMCWQKNVKNRGVIA